MDGVHLAFVGKFIKMIGRVDFILSAMKNSRCALLKALRILRLPKNDFTESSPNHGGVKIVAKNYEKMAFMSEDSWKTGLSPSQLNKIAVVEKHRDGLKQELAKKNYNFDILQQALDKEKRKVRPFLEIYLIQFEFRALFLHLLGVHIRSLFIAISSNKPIEPFTEW